MPVARDFRGGRRDLGKPIRTNSRTHGNLGRDIELTRKEAIKAITAAHLPPLVLAGQKRSPRGGKLERSFGARPPPII